MKKYDFTVANNTVAMDNTVSLNGNFFKVTEAVSDEIFKILQTALDNETAKLTATGGAMVKPETVAKSEPKTSSKTSTKSTKKASTKSDADSDSAEVSADEVSKMSEDEAKHIYTKVATMTPYGSKGIIVSDVAQGTWKVIRQRLVSKFGDDVEYIRQKDDPKGQGHFEFRSKTLRDKALNDDSIPVVYWDSRKFNKGKKRG